MLKAKKKTVKKAEKPERKMVLRKYLLRVDFTMPVLGTQPQRDIAEEFIVAKVEELNGEMPDDEKRTAPEELERSTTAFHKLDGKPILYDYQVKGFIKEAGGVFNGLHGVTGLRQKIDNQVFVRPRQIILNLPTGAEIEYCDRPLRARTMQGDRVALARSEMIPEGTRFECELHVYDGQISATLLRELLSYGQQKGIGQWRNASYGQFTYDLVLDGA